MLLVLVFILVAGGVVIFSYASEVFAGQSLTFLNLDVVRASIVLLAIAVSLYVWEKERALGRLERALVEERILSAALEHRVREMGAILRAGRAVASTLSLDDVLELILHTAQELLGPDRGLGHALRLGEATPPHRRLRRARRAGQAPRSIPIGEGVAGWVAEFRGAGRAERRSARPEVPQVHPQGPLGPLGDVRAAVRQRRAVGVLNVSVSNGEREYTEHDLRALTVFAEHAAHRHQQRAPLRARARRVGAARGSGRAPARVPRGRDPRPQVPAHIDPRVHAPADDLPTTERSSTRSDSTRRSSSARASGCWT